MKKKPNACQKKILISYTDDHIYRILLSNDRIMKTFKVI